ncbi:MAG TPA: hypothetical protein VL346_06460 [Acidobacteriaceae bacterium]|nr:hypothetical protein [Acidobacteriaceae bacterium]
MRNALLHAALLAFTAGSCATPLFAQKIPAPGSRTITDAHNCYPYYEWWYDRIDRALSTGTPVAIEQDLAWYTDKKTGKSWSIVTHGEPLSPQSPTMEHYFFDKVKPIVEQALKDGDKSKWPIITLNLDFKDNKPEHLAAVLALLKKYQGWLTTAPKTGDPAVAQPLDIKPILVLTGESDAQQKVFFDNLAHGDRVLLFGAIHTGEKDHKSTPEELDPDKASNYRRWWNNAWNVVEFDGQQHAGEWTQEKDARLRALVARAHANNLWIRFYTLDGATEKELSANGWFHGYNFGTLEAAKKRWDAAIAAKVDYIASDEYELLGKEIRNQTQQSK